ncbi:hypothetical protein OC844_001567 [Tilletia horrida]|nr:hypothetical protein OC844_001567 [Tilletia horrida]
MTDATGSSTARGAGAASGVRPGISARAGAGVAPSSHAAALSGDSASSGPVLQRRHRDELGESGSSSPSHAVRRDVKATPARAQPPFHTPGALPPSRSASRPEPEPGPSWLLMSAHLAQDTFAALLLRLPFSIHVESWSGGNPTLALVVVAWVSASAMDEGNAAAGREDEVEGEEWEEEAAAVLLPPAGWGVSFSDWTSLPREHFLAHPAAKSTSVPPSPYLRSTPTSPRMRPASSSTATAGSAPSTPKMHAFRSRQPSLVGVAELDWSGASSTAAAGGSAGKSSPQIRPLGWAMGSAGAGVGRTMSYTGGGTGRRSSSAVAGGGANGGASGAAGGTTSLPGTPGGGLSSPRFSPFFGARAYVPTTAAASPSLGGTSMSGSGSGSGIGAGSKTARHALAEGVLPEADEDSHELSGSNSTARPNRARSPSVSSLASVPELSLGAAAVSFASASAAEAGGEGVGGDGGGAVGRPGGPNWFEHGPIPVGRSGGEPRLDAVSGTTSTSTSTPASVHPSAANPYWQARRRRRLQRRQSRLPLRMYRFPVTYAALLHYLSTALALRAVLDEVAPSRSASVATEGGESVSPRVRDRDRDRDRTRLVHAGALVLLCGMTMEGRGKAEALGLRRSSLMACAVLLAVVLVVVGA